MSEIQQLLDFLETFLRNFHTICPCFKAPDILAEQKVPTLLLQIYL